MIVKRVHYLEFSFSKDKNDRIVTKCRILLPINSDDSNFFSYMKLNGKATKHPNDKNDYYIGRKVALNNALENSILSKEERKVVWEEFFRRYKPDKDEVPVTKKELIDALNNAEMLYNGNSSNPILRDFNNNSKVLDVIVNIPIVIFVYSYKGFIIGKVKSPRFPEKYYVPMKKVQITETYYITED